MITSTSPLPSHTLAWLGLETAVASAACYFNMPSALARAEIETIIPFDPTNLSSESSSFIHWSGSFAWMALLGMGLFAKTGASFIKETCCSRQLRQIRAVRRYGEGAAPLSTCQKAKRIGKEALVQIAGIGAQAALIAIGLSPLIIKFTRYFIMDLRCWVPTSRGEEMLASCAAWDSMEHTAEQRNPAPETITQIVHLATSSLFMKVAIPVAIGFFCVRQIPTLFPETASRISSWLANFRDRITHREEIEI